MALSMLEDPCGHDDKRWPRQPAENNALEARIVDRIADSRDQTDFSPKSLAL